MKTYQAILNKIEDLGGTQPSAAKANDELKAELSRLSVTSFGSMVKEVVEMQIEETEDAKQACSEIGRSVFLMAAKEICNRELTAASGSN